MQWNSGLSAGFSSSESTWLPLNQNYPWLNVEKQASGEDLHNTHLGVYRDVMNFRKEIMNGGDRRISFDKENELFFAFSFDYGLLLNFGTREVTLNMLDNSDMPWGLFGAVIARSVNGLAMNEAGSVVDLSNVQLDRYEALLIKPLE